MTTIATHRQYLLCAARAVCKVCPDKDCKQNKESEATCAFLLDFRDTFISELARYADKAGNKTTKVCKKCGKEKPLTEFDRGYKYKDGYNTECKECRRIRGRERYAKKKSRMPSAENTKKLKKMKELQSLLGKTQAVTTDKGIQQNLRYKLVDEYREGRKEYAKRDYYDNNYYLARKYLKRAENGLAKATTELEQIRSEIEKTEGRELYTLMRKKNTRIAKIESYKYKIELCRSIIEGKVSLTQEDIDKAGIFHVKSSLLERLKKS